MTRLAKSITAAASVMMLCSQFALAEAVVTFTGEFAQVEGTDDTLGLVDSSFELAFAFESGTTFATANGVLGMFGALDAPVGVTLSITGNDGSVITSDTPTASQFPVFRFLPAGLPMAESGFFTTDEGTDLVFNVGGSVLDFDDELFIDLANLPSNGEAISLSTFAGSLVPIPAGQSVVQVDGFVNEFTVNNVQFTVAPIPDPSTLSLLSILGLSGVFVLRRRR